MALLKRFNLQQLATVIIWKTEESEETMLQRIKLHSSDLRCFKKLKHPEKRREFLASRCCLKAYYGENPEVYYHPSGKPYLRKAEKISFSHTHGYAALAISHHYQIGIDLELYRKGVRRIAPKFMRPEETKSLCPETEIQQLIHYWGAKEVMVKITGNRRLDFKKQLRVAPFLYRPFQHTSGLILQNDQIQKTQLYFKTLGDLHLSFGWAD